jgi:lipoprotein-anchoring transpeptidase ErfK/SrfK
MFTVLEKLNLRSNSFAVLVFLIFSAGNIFAQTSSENSKNRTFEAEKLLSDLGYWVLKVDGVADASTRHALIAFQKVEKRKRTGVLNERELEALRAATRPQPKFTGETHIEVDITRQVLFLVNESDVITHILPISSGSDEKYKQDGKWEVAHTPRGEFKVEKQIHGVRKAPLGNLYNPNYFHLGVAIHGSNSIPIYPASHGCVRIPRFADKLFIDMVSIGMKVYVYD